MNLLKKISLAALVAVAPTLAMAASPVRYVQISTNALSQQTGAFNVVSGTMTTLSVSTVTASSSTVNGPLNVTGTATLTTVAGTITDNSTSTYTGSQIFNGQLSFAAWSYRRPNLQFNSTTRVDVENNTATANTTAILFPDGNMFNVTENLGTTQKYRSFKSGQNAVFTSGTPQGGLRTSLTATANTWYALYAVKCQMTNETTNYVIVGDTFTPTQANVATLSSNFGTNGWVYLGMIRNGDGASTTTSILKFKQSGNRAALFNVVSSSVQANGANFTGIRLAATTGATNLTYTYAVGTAAGQVPSHINNVLVIGTVGNTTSGYNTISIGDSSYIYASWATGGILSGQQVWVDITGGLKENNSASASVPQDIILTGWIDDALGVGPNPQF